MIPGILTSYTDALSYEAGSVLRLYVSAPAPQPATIDLVRLDAALDSPGREGAVTVVPWDAAGVYDVAGQEGHYGSFATATIGQDDRAGLGEIGAFVRISGTGSDGDQTVLWVGDDAGDDFVALSLVDGVPSVSGSAAGTAWAVTADRRLVGGSWYLLTAHLSDGTAAVSALPVKPLYGDPVRSAAAPASAVRPAVVALAGRAPRDVVRNGSVTRGRATANFTGKIARPFVSAAPLEEADIAALLSGQTPAAVLGERAVAAWDLALADDASSEGATKTAGGASDLVVANLPTRAVTGPFWNGEERFTTVPLEHDAIHFHSTDVVDAGWEATVTAELPAGVHSGVYGVRVTLADGSRDVAPICIAPHRTAPQERILVLLPTFTYLAYANEAIFNGLDGMLTGGAPTEPNEADLAHVGNKTFGLSQYDHHEDGSGVAMSSAARPIVNIRHDYKMWLSESGRGFSGDMYLIEWLDAMGFAYDVITDYELHAWGKEFLQHYSVVVTGAHPEYHSAEMLDALEQYRDEGGRLVYLGGNGFYWVTGVVSESPLVIEIRRGNAGISVWHSEPGEAYLASTGERGGLWRLRGREPQRLVGIGMAAQGWGSSEPFHRSEASHAPEFDWIFEGVQESPIGAYGRVMGGAAGDEIDRADFALGTPPHAVVLASSRNHTNYYQRVVEEVGMILHAQHGGEVDPEVRGDIVYFSTPGGGEVFAAGSIAYSGALLHNNADNGISRMTANVLTRFSRPSGE